MKDVNYNSQKTPKKYRCANCKMRNCRLWREYNTFSPQLLCASCAEESQKACHDPGWTSPFSQGDGDQIGWYIPAIPDEEGAGYWGYGAVPYAGRCWWNSLPLVGTKKAWYEI